jgi:pSer/pThr/pTyr-binding forkhead associated (FHA) protein
MPTVDTLPPGTPVDMPAQSTPLPVDTSPPSTATAESPPSTPPVGAQQLQPGAAPRDGAESSLSFGILLICYPDERQEVFDLRRATVHVGRADDNDVILNDDLIAEHHAQILCDNSGCQVLDLGSHIGSQILERDENGKQTIKGLRLPPKMPYPLEKGTTVLMGEILLIYYPSTKELPKSVAKRESRLIHVLHTTAMILLLLTICGGSALWTRSLWAGASSRADSAPPPLEASTTAAAQPAAAPSSPASPTVSSRIYVVETTYELNLHIRSAPGLDQPILGKVAYGTVVRIWGEPIRVGPYHWVRVDAPNLSGWCIFDGLRPQ